MAKIMNVYGNGYGHLMHISLQLIGIPTMCQQVHLWRASYRALWKAFENRYVHPHMTGTRLAEETRLAKKVIIDKDTVETLYQRLL